MNVYSQEGGNYLGIYCLLVYLANPIIVHPSLLIISIIVEVRHMITFDTVSCILNINRDINLILQFHLCFSMLLCFTSTIII